MATEDISLSIEDTNALRAKLGLAPLLPPARSRGAAAAQGTGRGNDPKSREADDVAAARDAAERARAVRDKIERARTQRLRTERLVGASLGDADAPTFEDVGGARKRERERGDGGHGELAEEVLDANGLGSDVRVGETLVLEDESVLDGSRLAAGKNKLVALASALGGARPPDAGGDRTGLDPKEAEERRKRFREEDFSTVALENETGAAPSARALTEEALYGAVDRADARAAASKPRREKAVVIPKIVRRKPAARSVATGDVRGAGAGGGGDDDDEDDEDMRKLKQATALGAAARAAADENEGDEDDLEAALAKTRRAAVQRIMEAAAAAKERERRPPPETAPFAGDVALEELVVNQYARVNEGPKAAASARDVEMEEAVETGAAEAVQPTHAAVASAGDATAAAAAAAAEQKAAEAKVAQYSDLPGLETVGAARPSGGGRRGGLRAALTMLQATGEVHAREVVVGRATDTRLHADVNKPGDLVVLTYRDEHGRELTTEEAWRQQQYQRRGEQPGAKKREKRLEQIRQEEAVLAMQAGDTPLGTARATKEALKRAGVDHIVLGKR